MRKQIYQICQQSLVSDVEANDSIDRQRHDSNHQEPNSEIRQNKFVLLYGIVVVDTPVELCLERNRRRPAERQVPDRVILKMDQSWEAPTKTATTFNRVESFSSSSETPPPPPAAAAVENAEPTKTATAAPSAGRSAIIEFCRADDTVREYPLLKLDGRGGGDDGDDSKQLNHNVDRVRAFVIDLVSLSSSSPSSSSSALSATEAAKTRRVIEVRPPVDPNLERDRVEKEQNQTAKSYIHQADQTLRHCVKSVATIRRGSSKAANGVRQGILQKLKKTTKTRTKTRTTTNGGTTKTESSTEEANNSDHQRLQTMQELRHAFLLQFLALVEGTEEWSSPDMEALRINLL